MNDFRPDVSVCIANYNGMAFLDACLDSVLTQEGSLRVEIIVHDDASTDDSVLHIRSNFPQIILLESVINVGFCTANNRMAEKASGKYLLLLNNDATLFPDALRTLHTAAQSTDAAVLGLPQYDMANGKLIDRGSLLDPFLNPIPNLDSRTTDVNMIIGACLWIPHMLWNEIGGFPGWFGSMAEDMYLCCAAKLRGHPVIALRESGFRHHVGASFGGGKIGDDQKLVTSLKRRTLSERNKSFVMALVYPAPMFQFIFPLHLLLLLLEGALLSIVKRDWSLMKKIYIACVRKLWEERATLIRLRRQIQASRKIGRFEFFKGFQALPHKLVMLLRHGLPKIS